MRRGSRNIDAHIAYGVLSSISVVAITRSHLLGPAARPVAVPEDVDDAKTSKVQGVVELPHHIRWSGPPATYDLSDPVDRARVYELVLQEGTDEDVRRYIDVDQLRSMWADLVLPPWVRSAWADWFRRHRGVDLAC